MSHHPVRNLSFNALAATTTPSRDLELMVIMRPYPFTYVDDLFASCSKLLGEIEEHCARYNGYTDERLQQLSEIELKTRHEEAEGLHERHADEFRNANGKKSQFPAGWEITEVPKHCAANMRILQLSRRLRYAQARKPCFPLPNNFKNFTLILPWSQERPRQMIAARIMWAKKRREARITTSDVGKKRLRYETLKAEDYCQQRKELLKEYNWMTKIPLSLEWMAMLDFAGQLTRWEDECTIELDGIVAEFKMRGVIDEGCRLKVANHARPSSKEEAEKEYGVGSQCTICHQLFDHAAVETYCTPRPHYFCADCLEMWINSDVNRARGSHKCPLCKTEIVDAAGCRIGLLPGEIQPVLERYVDAFRENRELDREIDEFLLGHPEMGECYNSGVGEMLERLGRRFAEQKKLRGELAKVSEYIAERDGNDD